MKTNDHMVTSVVSRGYITAASVFLLLAALSVTSADAQNRNRGGERNTYSRENNGRQNSAREQRPGMQGGDMARTDNGRGRNYNYGQDMNRNRYGNNGQDMNRNYGNGGINNRDINRNRDNNNGRTGGQDAIIRDRNAGTGGTTNRDAYRNGGGNNVNRSPDRGRENNAGYGNNNFRRSGYYNNRPGTLNRPSYRPVYGYNRNPVYSPYNPSWRYGYLPRRNSYFYSLPGTYININFGGIGYRYYDGVFYRPYNNLFTVIAPPIGIYINVLPLGYRRIYVHDYPYYYYNGTYYDQRGSNYYVVSPPLGAVVESLPAGYDTVVIDGETYYVADGAQYKPVIQENGEIWYEVIKAN